MFTPQEYYIMILCAIFFILGMLTATGLIIWHEGKPKTDVPKSLLRKEHVAEALERGERL